MIGHLYRFFIALIPIQWITQFTYSKLDQKIQCLANNNQNVNNVNSRIEAFEILHDNFWHFSLLAQKNLHKNYVCKVL